MSKLGMYKKTKLWRSMSAASLAGIAVLGGCASPDANDPQHAGTDLSARHGEGEGEPIVKNEGEGEGKSIAQGEGEGEGASDKPDFKKDDVAYLTQLGLMRGHLLVGYQLYQAGEFAHANTHMKHPESELYADIAPALKARGSRGFADELKALAQAVERKAPAGEVDKAYQAVTAAIAASEAVAPATSRAEPGPALKRTVNLLRTAADEYAIGVVKGKLANAHEYQDAYGFTKIAAEVVNDIDITGNAEHAQAITKVKALIAELDTAWPSLAPKGKISTDASVLYGKTAEVELIASGID